MGQDSRSGDHGPRAETGTKDALLSAAVRVFARKGFQEATVREICREAKANVAAVNYHFGGKEALYRAALETVFSMKDPAADEFADRTRPAEDRLRGYLDSIVDELYVRCPSDKAGQDKHALFMIETMNPSPHLDIMVQLYVQPRADLLRDILRDLLGPKAPDQVLRDCAQSIWAQMLHPRMFGAISDRLKPRLPSPAERLDEYKRHLIRFSLGGLEGIRRRLNKDSE
ncbi:MAG: CerR family C-terminal domain-containing protein [Desulfovibrionaceae bacterium]|nr:CerR family C-terminal domain-containing protein [Desulfovibrionaceae bacterium]MDD4952934.1 CerR family C-terminal domain-containing protein [Desulfovibrionaceae bacterium]